MIKISHYTLKEINLSYIAVLKIAVKLNLKNSLTLHATFIHHHRFWNEPTCWKNI